MTLDSHVSLLIPSKVGKCLIDKAVRNKAINHVAAEFAKLVGGSTIKEQKGCWFSEADGLVVEKVTEVVSFCQKDSLMKLESLAKLLAGQYKQELQQEAMAMEVNGEMILV
jgi:hypothetical protein